MRTFAKTKILATVGPACDSERMLGKLIDSGIDAFRLNFSHGNHEYFATLFDRIEKIRAKKNSHIAILADLQGPKIRVADLIEPEIELKKGKIIEIAAGKKAGNAGRIFTPYKPLVRDANSGDEILIDDGLLRFKVVKKLAGALQCRVISGGVLKPHKGINLPGMKLKSGALTKKDFDDLAFLLKYNVDFIALSFVRDAADVKKLKKWLLTRGKSIPVIAKIEKPEAVENLPEILNSADGIMVARGDLGVEMETHDLPIVQKRLIYDAKAAGKLVITATQMLESMIQNPVPTRAEATDIANAVWDGTDVVMLSGETSVGKYPLQAVQKMNDIVMTAEDRRELKRQIKYKTPDQLSENLFDSAGKAIVTVACQVNAAAIVVLTHHGRKARVISKYHPDVPILAVSDAGETLRNLNLQWGILPIETAKLKNTDAALALAIEKLRKEKLVKKNDVIILTSGAPLGEKGRENWLRFVVV